MVSAKTMANGYQPSIEVKRGGKANHQHSRLRTATHVLRWADALTTFSCPQQTQTTHRTHPTLRTTRPITTHLFLPFFSKSVSLQKQYIYVYGPPLAAHALVRAFVLVCLCMCACVFLNICSPNKRSPHPE